MSNLLIPLSLIEKCGKSSLGMTCHFVALVPRVIDSEENVRIDAFRSAMTEPIRGREIDRRKEVRREAQRERAGAAGDLDP